MASRSSSDLLHVLVAVVLLLSATPARAEEAEAKAEALIQEGVALRMEGREADAFERFREAHELHPTPRARGQMGLAAKSLRRYVEAEQFLEEALGASDDPWVQQNREALELALDIVAKQLASLLVTSNVEGAELVVNGAVVGRLPLEGPVRVLAGAARVEVRAPLHDAASSDATLPAGVVTELRIDLVPSPPPPALLPPPAPLPLPPHPPEPAPPAVESDVWRSWLYGTGGVVGAVGVGLGIYFGVRTIMKKEERDEVCPDEACATEDGVALDEAARTAATLSTVSFVAGASGVVAALVVWLADVDEPTSLVVHDGGAGWRFSF